MGMPFEQAALGQWLAEVLRSIQHHLDRAISSGIVVVFQIASPQPQLESERGTDIFGIKSYAFDGARLDGLLGQYFQGRSPSRIPAIALHLPEQ